jgi:tRNA-Thr(GGU) m(6)t(6)A37 methyltransferase TsaA
MNLETIGIIHSPHQESQNTPLQPHLATGSEGTVEVFPQFAAGLKDLDGFERIWLLYWFDRAAEPQLLVTPYLDDERRGLFATRAPCRPNPIGFSAVRLLRIEGNILKIADLDILDGTPLLDIKPYVPSFDVFAVQRIGWCGSSKKDRQVADGRFEGPGGKSPGHGKA